MQEEQKPPSHLVGVTSGGVALGLALRVALSGPRSPAEVWNHLKNLTLTDLLVPVAFGVAAYFAALFVLPFLRKYETRIESGFQRRYLGFLARALRNLEEVYVPCAVTPDPPALSSGRGCSNIRGDKQPSVLDLVMASRRQCDRILLVGGSGAGKTTLLRRMALLLANKGRCLSAVLFGAPIPVYMNLPSYATEIGRQTSLLELIRYITVDRRQLAAPRDWPSYYIGKGRVLLLVDGLDDIGAPTQRSDVFRWLDSQLEDQSLLRVVVACRPETYHSLQPSALSPSAFVPMYINPLSDAQVRLFVLKTLRHQRRGGRP